MAYDTAFFENPRTGQRRKAPMGFSWTMFFFGWLAAAIRGDWRWFIIILLLSLVTFGCAGFVAAFIWNKSYIRRLVDNGFELRTTASGNDQRLMNYVGENIPQLATQS